MSSVKQWPAKHTVQEWRLTIENTETIISHIASRSQLTRGTAELGVFRSCDHSDQVIFGYGEVVICSQGGELY